MLMEIWKAMEMEAIFFTFRLLLRYRLREKTQKKSKKSVESRGKTHLNVEFHKHPTVGNNATVVLNRKAEFRRAVARCKDNLIVVFWDIS